MATIELLAAAVARALRPLTFAMRSEDGIRNLLAEIGWTIPTVPPSLAAMGEGLIQLHTSLTELVVSRSRVDLGGGSPSDIDAALATLVLDLAVVGEQLHELPAHLRAELPAEFVAATLIDDELEDRLFDWLLSIDIAQHAAVLYRLLRVAGVIEVEDEAADPARFQPAFRHHRIRWERLIRLIDPASLAREVYGWGTAAIDTGRLFGELVPLSFAFGMPAEVRYATAEFTLRTAPAADPDAEPIPQLWVPVLRTDDFALFVVAAPVAKAIGQELQGFALAMVPSTAGESTIPFGEALELTVQAGAQIGTGAALILRPDQPPSVLLDMNATTGGALTSGRISAVVTWRAGEGDIPAGLSANNGTSITARAISIGLGATATSTDADVFAELVIRDGRLVVAPPADDGFLASVLPEGGLNALFSLEVRWSRNGLHFEGSTDLTTAIPLHGSVGPLTLQSLELKVATKDSGVTAGAALTAAIELDPVTVTIEGMGVGVLARTGHGNLGPLDLDIHFIWPTGAGLSIDAAVVTGGGFIGRDPASGRYSGVFDVRVGQIDITALGLLDTKLPAGHGGYALLLALRATFPAVQIGFGFALTGVGGLLALNHRVDVDVLRGRLAAGTAGRVLAPQDPVRNASALLADLDAVFPVAPGITVVGPTVQLLWAGLVHLDVGVFIELPGPARVVLLGSAHAEIERDGRAYLSIRVDIVGVVDLRAETAAFDAALIDSHLMGMLDLTGGAAFRLSWGAQPYAVLSLGGFNPAYHPEPLSFPATLTRIAMVHGTPSDELYLRFEGYFAITSNTLQFGASVEVIIQSDHFIVHGSVGFDALIQRSPFHFRFDIRASVTVAYRGQTLAGLTLTGSLTGPGPVVVQAKVCIELLFFDICFSGTFPLGPAIAPLLAAAAGLLDTLLSELGNPATLRAAGAPDPYVRLQPPDPSLTAAVIAPSGTLVWEQQSAPLDLLLTRVGGAPLSAPAQVSATSPASSTAQSDWFAPGQFIDLTDDQALTRPAYERLTGGLRLAGAGVADGPGAQALLTTTQIRLPADAATPGKPVIMFPAWILTSAPGPATPAITVRTESWIVTTPAGEHHDLTGAQARQLATLTTSARAIPATDRLAAFTF